MKCLFTDMVISKLLSNNPNQYEKKNVKEAVLGSLDKYVLSGLIEIRRLTTVIEEEKLMIKPAYPP